MPKGCEYAHPVARSRDGENAHLPGSQPAGSNSRPKTVDMPHPVTRSRDRGNAHLPGSQPAGSNSRTKAVNMPTRSHAAGTEETPHLPGSQPAGSNSRTKTVDVPHPVTRSRDGENAPSAGQPACGEQFAHKGCGCALPGLRRRPAAQNKKGTRIGCLSVWCG